MEKVMAPNSSTLAWKIPWTEEPGRLQSMGWLRVRHDWATALSLFTFMYWRRKWQPTPVSLLGESQGHGKIPWTEEPGGLPSTGLHRVRHDWRDLAAAAKWVGFEAWTHHWLAMKFGQISTSQFLFPNPCDRGYLLKRRLNEVLSVKS